MCITPIYCVVVVVVVVKTICVPLSFANNVNRARLVLSCHYSFIHSLTYHDDNVYQLVLQSIRCWLVLLLLVVLLLSLERMVTSTTELSVTVECRVVESYVQITKYRHTRLECCHRTRVGHSIDARERDEKFFVVNRLLFLPFEKTDHPNT